MTSSRAASRSLASLLAGVLLALTAVADSRGAAAAEPSGPELLARVMQAANKEVRLVATIQASGGATSCRSSPTRSRSASG